MIYIYISDHISKNSDYIELWLYYIFLEIRFLQGLTLKNCSPWIHCWKLIWGSCIPSCRSSPWFGVTEHVMPCRETNDGNMKRHGVKGSRENWQLIFVIIIIMISYTHGLLGKLLEVVSFGSMADFVRPVVCGCLWCLCSCIILYVQICFYIRIYLMCIYIYFYLYIV